MIYLPNFYGGMCNNLLQFNNALEFLKHNELDCTYLKINVKHTDKSRDKNNHLLRIFNELSKNYVNLKGSFIKNTQHILYNSYPPIKIDKNRDYILNHSFYAKDSSYSIYNYLRIFQYQKEIFERFRTILKNKLTCYHIRLGDFLTNPRFVKYVLPESEIIKNINKNRYYLILTNHESIDYIKRITNKFKNIIYAFDLKLQLDEEFILGSICENVIMSKNSSFSLLLSRFNKYFKEKI